VRRQGPAAGIEQKLQLAQRVAELEEFLARLLGPCRFHR
jgi:hypothetical protein